MTLWHGAPNVLIRPCLLELSRVECLVMSRGLFGGNCPGGKCLRGISVGRNVQMPIQDYKSLCVAVMICATLVST